MWLAVFQTRLVAFQLLAESGLLLLWQCEMRLQPRIHPSAGISRTRAQRLTQATTGKLRLTILL